MNDSYNFGELIQTTKKTELFAIGEELQILSVERGAPEKPYYCYSEIREVGEWLSERQIRPALINKQLQKI